MITVNRATIIGVVENLISFKILSRQIEEAKFYLITSERWIEKGVQRERKQRHTIKFKGKLAASAHKLLKSGVEVYIEGAMRNNGGPETEIEAEMFKPFEWENQEAK